MEPRPPSDVKSIFCLMIGRIGDVIETTPFLRALKSRHPKARLSLVIRQSCRELVPLLSWIDEVRALPRPLDLPAQIAFFSGLRNARADLVVDLNSAPSRTSALIARLIPSKEKLSFSKGRWDGVFNRKIPEAGDHEPMSERYRRLAEALDAPYEPRTELRLDDKDAPRAREALGVFREDGGTRILIHPGNFKKFDNRWPEENFIALTDALAEDSSLRIAYLAGPGEKSRVEAIVRGLKKPVPILGPSPLGIAAQMISAMDLCVLNSTGTLHLAEALNVPTFGFYSGYTNAVWRPRGSIHSGAVSDSWTSCRDVAVEEALKKIQPVLERLKSRASSR